MDKRIKKIIFKLVFISVLLMMPPAFGQAALETITITTYYPAPHGVYNRLLTQTLGVGDNNNDGVLNGSDAPDASDPNQAGNVWIRGGLGINTAAPRARLEVNNTIKFEPQTALTLPCVKGSVVYYEGGGEKVFKHCDGTSWKNIGGSKLGTATVTPKRTLSSGGKCAGGAVRNNVVDCPIGTVLTGIRIEEGTDHCPYSCNFYSNAIVKYALICRAIE